MVGRKDDEWPPGNGSPKTGSSTVMALDPTSVCDCACVPWHSHAICAPQAAGRLSFFLVEYVLLYTSYYKFATYPTDYYLCKVCEVLYM